MLIPKEEKEPLWDCVSVRIGVFVRLRVDVDAHSGLEVLFRYDGGEDLKCL